jgi:hypothetical protein
VYVNDSFADTLEGGKFTVIWAKAFSLADEDCVMVIKQFA